MTKKRACLVHLALLISWIAMFLPAAGAGGDEKGKKKKPPKNIADLYGRIAGDLAQKKPLVVTVYVTLCDNDTTVLVKVKNAKMCNGESPGSNIYWSTSGGLKTYLNDSGWNNLAYKKNPDEKLAVKGIWRKTYSPGGYLKDLGIEEDFDVYVVGLAYRGAKFKEAIADYLKAVHKDKGGVEKIDGPGSLRYGGASHLVGYIGHDYFLNEDYYDELMSHAKGGSTFHKGVFALSCFGKQMIRPAVTRPNTHILLMNRSLTYPGAWAVGGIIEGIAKGKDGAGIHYEACLAFAAGKKMPLESVLSAFSYGG